MGRGLTLESHAGPVTQETNTRLAHRVKASLLVVRITCDRKPPIVKKVPSMGTDNLVASCARQRSDGRQRPEQTFEPVNWYTSQPCAVFCIHEPMSDTNWPMKNNLKLRCFNAAKVSRHVTPPRFAFGRPARIRQEPLGPGHRLSRHQGGFCGHL